MRYMKCGVSDRSHINSIYIHTTLHTKEEKKRENKKGKGRRSSKKKRKKNSEEKNIFSSTFSASMISIHGPPLADNLTSRDPLNFALLLKCSFVLSQVSPEVLVLG